MAAWPVPFMGGCAQGTLWSLHHPNNGMHCLRQTNDKGHPAPSRNSCLTDEGFGAIIHPQP